jgi:hypothetical protein
MIHSLLKAGALALGSLTLAAPALAITSLPLNGAAPLVVLAQDLENQEVWQDLRPDVTPPEAAVGKKEEEAPKAPVAEPPMERGSGDVENKELWQDLETGVTPPPGE